MLGNLLKQDQWQALFACQDLEALRVKLTATRYAQWTKNVSGEAFVRSFDLGSEAEHLATEKKLSSFLSGASAELVELLIEQYDIEYIKQGLRSWAQKKPFTIPPESNTSLRYKIPWDIFNAQSVTIEELILQLIHTPYGKCLSSARELYQTTGNVFYLESALEKDLFERIYKQITLLSGKDRQSISKLLGVYIDILNIKTLMRCKLYFNIPPDHLQHVLYPAGAYLNMKESFNTYTSKDSREFLKSLSGTLSPLAKLSSVTQTAELADAVNLLNVLLQEFLHKEISKTLSGYPFTLGVVLAYILLNQWELKTLRSLAWSLFLGTKDTFKDTFDSNPITQKK